MTGRDLEVARRVLTWLSRPCSSSEVRRHLLVGLMTLIMQRGRRGHQGGEGGICAELEAAACQHLLHCVSAGRPDVQVLMLEVLSWSSLSAGM